jgi:hypothetical protein
MWQSIADAERRHETRADAAPAAPSAATPSSARHDRLLLLQRAAGNQAVSRLLRGDGRAVDPPHPLIESGHPLPASVRLDFEQRFGADFGSVRIHRGGGVDSFLDDQNAEAVTIGENVAISSRQAMSGPGSRRLLAHELAHVVQQRRGGPPPSPLTGSSSEQAAARAADALDGPAERVTVGGATSVGIARQARTGVPRDAFVASIDYPPSPDAFPTIQLYYIFGDEFFAGKTDFTPARPYVSRYYSLIPLLRRGDPVTVYAYLAFNRDVGRNEVVIGPSMLGFFLEHEFLYRSIAGASYPFVGEPQPYQVSSARSVVSVMTGQPGEAAKHYGVGALQAVTSRHFWTQVALSNAPLLKSGPAVPTPIEAPPPVIEVPPIAPIPKTPPVGGGGAMGLAPVTETTVGGGVVVKTAPTPLGVPPVAEAPVPSRVPGPAPGSTGQAAEALSRYSGYSSARWVPKTARPPDIPTPLVLPGPAGSNRQITEPGPEHPAAQEPTIAPPVSAPPPVGHSGPVSFPGPESSRNREPLYAAPTGDPVLDAETMLNELREQIRIHEARTKRPVDPAVRAELERLAAELDQLWVPRAAGGMQQLGAAEAALRLQSHLQTLSSSVSQPRATTALDPFDTARWSEHLRSLPERERMAEIARVVDEQVAPRYGWVYDGAVSALNTNANTKRTVYRDDTRQRYYSVDWAHGTLEVHDLRGSHLAEADYNLVEEPGSARRDHDIRVP